MIFINLIIYYFFRNSFVHEMVKFNPFMNQVEERIDYIEPGYDSSQNILSKILSGSHVFLDTKDNFVERLV